MIIIWIAVGVNVGLHLYYDKGFSGFLFHGIVLGWLIWDYLEKD